MTVKFEEGMLSLCFSGLTDDTAPREFEFNKDPDDIHKEVYYVLYLKVAWRQTRANSYSCHGNARINQINPNDYDAD